MKSWAVLSVVVWLVDDDETFAQPTGTLLF